MNHKQQGVLEDDGTVMGKEDGSFLRGLDIAECLAVVGMDDVRQRLAGMHTTTYIDQAKQNARMTCLDVL
jgi:hypothetical protein